MKPQYDWRSHPDVPGLMDRTVAAEAERLIETHNAAILQPLALYLGTWKSEISRALLRRLKAEGTVREQAEICLRWIGRRRFSLTKSAGNFALPIRQGQL